MRYRLNERVWYTASNGVKQLGKIAATGPDCYAVKFDSEYAWEPVVAHSGQLAVAGDWQVGDEVMTDEGHLGIVSAVVKDRAWVTFWNDAHQIHLLSSLRRPRRKAVTVREYEMCATGQLYWMSHISHDVDRSTGRLHTFEVD